MKTKPERIYRILHNNKGQYYTDPKSYKTYEEANAELIRQIRERINVEFAVIISIIGSDLNSMGLEHVIHPIPF